MSKTIADEIKDTASAVDTTEEEFDEEEITFGLSLADLRKGVKEDVPVEYGEGNQLCTISFKTDFMVAEDEIGLYTGANQAYFRTLARIIANAITKWDLEGVVTDTKTGLPVMVKGKTKKQLLPITYEMCSKVLGTDMLIAIYLAMNKALRPNP